MVSFILFCVLALSFFSGGAAPTKKSLTEFALLPAKERMGFQGMVFITILYDHFKDHISKKKDESQSHRCFMLMKQKNFQSHNCITLHYNTLRA